MVAPILLSATVAWSLARLLPPRALGLAPVPWFIGVAGLATACLLATERVMRRFAPLPILLSLALVFPDEAPNRYRMALKTGSTRQLARRIDEVRASGQALDTEQNYAEQMLELLAMLSAHDRLTRGHCERVRAYTDLLIDEFKLGAHDAARLRWAALLHDLGKLMVPAEILNKKGRPDEDEWEILKSHTWQGDRLAAPLAGWLGEWSAAIGQHHERWDGAGYPNGLAGTDIHFGARLVAVADTFDVMTSARSYKKPLPASVARQEIARCAGGQFDPDVARAFLAIGINRLRLVAGPLSSVSALLGLPSVTTTAVPVLAGVSGAVGAALVAATAALVPGVLDDAPPRPDELAFDAEDPTRSDSPSTTVVVPAVSEAVDVEIGELSAGDDVVSVTEGEAATVDVLANDTSPDGSLMIVSHTTAGNGTVELTGTVLRYQHDGSETGADSFEYTVEDGNGSTVTGMVTVVVEPVNDPPTIAPSVFLIEESAEIGDLIGVIDVDDPDSDTLSLVTSSPLVTVDENGVLELTDEPGPAGTSFEVEVTVTDDVGASVAGSIEIRVVTAEELATSTTGGTTSTTVPSTTSTPAPTTTTPGSTTTTTAPPPPGVGLVISEFAAAGANPSGDFVELYNGTGSAVALAAVDLHLLDDGGVIETIDLGTGTLAAGAHLLAARSGTSLAGSADVTFTTGLPLSIAIGIDSASGYLDVVGTRERPEAMPSIVAASAIAEGQGVPPFDPGATSNPQSYVRRHGTNGGSCVDTGNNSADFVRSFHAAGVTPTSSSAGTFSCGSAGSSPGTPVRVVIAEIRTDGPGSSSNEFVELFNPTAIPVPLAGLRLINDDAEVQYVFTTEVMAAGRRLLLAHSDFTGPTPDGVFSGGGVENDGGLTLEVTATGVDIDRVSFGGSSPDLPPLGGRLQHSYTRRFGGCIDTGDHYVDFEHALIETPQTSAAAATPC